MNAHRADPVRRRTRLLRIASAVAVLSVSLVAVQGGASATQSNVMVNTEAPVIAGVAKAGETLTASTGSWTPNPRTYSYMWTAGSLLLGHNSNQLVVPGSAVGKRIKVSVTPSQDDYVSTSADSAPTDVVVSSEYTNIQPPQLTTTARVGDRYSINPGRWLGLGTQTYQLLADGVEVLGATGRTGPITASMIGKKLTVRETISSVGYASASSISAQTAAVTPGTYSVHFGSVGVRGPAVVGEQLRLSDDVEFDPSGFEPLVTTVAYQWFADASPIAGATGTTFTLTSAQKNKVVTIAVTASGDGYASKTVTSDETAPVVDAGVTPVTAGDADLLGAPRVGSLFSVYTWLWSPTPVTFSYQWLADGVEIAGATKPTFIAGSAQVGKRISARVTGSRARFLPTTVTTAESEVVTGATSFGSPQNLASPSSTPESIDLNWTAVDGATKYRIYYGIGSGKRTKLEVKNTTVATIKKLKPDTHYSIDISAFKKDGTQSSYSHRINVDTADFNPPSYFKLVASTPNSLTFEWEKVDGAVKYRLYSGPASGSKMTKLEVGDVSTVTIKKLTSRTDYNVRIAAILPSGRVSDYTTDYRAHTPSTG